MKTRQVWTPYRDEILRKRYPKEGASKALCGLLGVTRGAVCKRAQFLKISVNRLRKWTNAEDSKIRAIYPDSGTSILKKELGRTPRSILMRAFFLGVKYTPQKDGGRNHFNYRGGVFVSHSYFGSLKHSALIRGLSFDISISEIEKKLEKQNHRCALTGVEISFSENGHRQTASVDRINSAFGYTLDNIQLTHKTANLMKLDMTQSEFRHWCSLVVNHLPVPTAEATKNS